MLRLIPVVEAHSGKCPFDWVPLNAGGDLLELGPHCGDDDVMRIIAILATYNGVAESGSIPEVVQALQDAERLVLPGGLLARSGDFELVPGCCCGLEDWRDWFFIKPGSASPWLGNDPSPRVDCDSEVATLWADGEAGDQSPYLSVPYAEIERARNETCEALIGFKTRLTAWLAAFAPQGQSFSGRFAEAFDIVDAI
jgi:hypothetical protein